MENCHMNFFEGQDKKLKYVMLLLTICQQIQNLVKIKYQIFTWKCNSIMNNDKLSRSES